MDIYIGGLSKTTNGGSNWFAVINGSFESFYFLNPQTGWAVTRMASVAKTTNEGVNWKVKTSEMNLVFKSVFFANENTGWIVGEKGTILRTTNGGK